MDEKTIKQEHLKKLYQSFRNKDSCPFGFSPINTTVLGDGNPNAKLMFIGEAPGRDEDQQGKPFVGRSGQLLNRVLEAAGLTRHDVFITNVVKWRPPNNRQPTIAEMELCKNLLLDREIAIIDPKIICTLGSSALHALVDPDIKITRVRGKLLQKNHLNIVPTYHPAYILRNNKELEHFMSDILYAVELAK